MGTRYNRLNGGREGVLITRVCYRDGKTFFKVTHIIHIGYLMRTVFSSVGRWGGGGGGGYSDISIYIGWADFLGSTFLIFNFCGYFLRVTS